MQRSWFCIWHVVSLSVSSIRYLSGKLQTLDTPPVAPEEYVMICTEVGCDATRGLDFRGFSRMVDDEEDRAVLNCVGKWTTGLSGHQSRWGNWTNRSLSMFVRFTGLAELAERKRLQMWKLAPSALEDVLHSPDQPAFLVKASPLQLGKGWIPRRWGTGRNSEWRMSCSSQCICQDNTPQPDIQTTSCEWSPQSNFLRRRVLTIFELIAMYCQQTHDRTFRPLGHFLPASRGVKKAAALILFETICHCASSE